MSVFQNRWTVGRSYKLHELEGVLNSLLRRGYHNGRVVITDKRGNNICTIEKYIYIMKNYGLLICFSNSENRNFQFNELTNYCKIKNINHIVEHSHKDKNSKTLKIDCQKDISMATFFVKRIIRNIMGIKYDDNFLVSSESCSPWDELIEDPHQEPLPLVEGIKSLNAVVKNKFGVSVLDMVLTAVLAVVQLVGILGTAYSIFLARSTWRWIHFNVSGISVEAPAVGLAFFALMLFGALRIFTQTYWKRRGAPKDQGQVINPHSQSRAVGFKYVLMSPLNLISLIIIFAAIRSWM